MNIHPHGYWPEAGCERSHLCSAKLAGWLARHLERNVPTYDFGCGLGTYLLALQEVGFTQLRGFEGEPPLGAHFKSIEKADLTITLPVRIRGNVICLEVAEHLPEEYSDVLLDTITGACAHRLVTSWAIRGQGGQGHCNELDNYEVIPRFAGRGFRVDIDATREARALAGADLGWFRQSLLIMRRTS